VDESIDRGGEFTETWKDSADNVEYEVADENAIDENPNEGKDDIIDGTTVDSDENANEAVDEKKNEEGEDDITSDEIGVDENIAEGNDSGIVDREPEKIPDWIEKGTVEMENIADSWENDMHKDVDNTWDIVDC
jgi:hypothetical protein